MKWIKASERLPEEKDHSDVGGLIYLKIHDDAGTHCLTGYFSVELKGNCFFDSMDYTIKNDYENIEWLDESELVEDKWISVDTLPPQDTWLLLNNEYWTGVGKYCKAEDEEFPEPEWQDERTEYIPVPLFWQPLPSPPIK